MRVRTSALVFVITIFFIGGAFVLNKAFSKEISESKNPCVQCHEKISPGQVIDWKASRHFEEDITCS
ncbi:MAG: hypothetical protein KAJ15_04435, partial [Spirochaetes bacterium]|nr:hypothetical protein [Spirochaetota bacterium]